MVLFKQKRTTVRLGDLKDLPTAACLKRKGTRLFLVFEQGKRKPTLVKLRK